MIVFPAACAALKAAASKGNPFEARVGSIQGRGDPTAVLLWRPVRCCTCHPAASVRRPYRTPRRRQPVCIGLLYLDDAAAAGVRHVEHADEFGQPHRLDGGPDRSGLAPARGAFGTDSQVSRHIIGRFRLGSRTGQPVDRCRPRRCTLSVWRSLKMADRRREQPSMERQCGAAALRRLC